MSISATAVFEVRTAGSDTNGGGYVPGAGTDMSQFDNKNSAGGTNCQSTTSNLSTTDAVTNNTTTVTSATAAFTSAISNNLVYLTGSGTTTGWYQATYVSATSITVDRATGSTGGTGVTINVGGAFATPQPVYGASMTFAAGATPTIWIKSGTYTLTATWTLNITSSGNNVLMHIGYHSSRGDNDGTRPVITSATNSVGLFTASIGSANLSFRNIKFTHTAGTRGIGIQPQNSNNNLRVENCIFDGCLWGINGDNAGARYPWLNVLISDTEIKNCVTGGVLVYSGNILIMDSWIHANTGYGVESNNAVVLFIVRSTISSNGTVGVGNNSGSGFVQTFLIDSNFYANGATAGVAFTNQNGVASTQWFSLIARNCIFYGNTGYGLSASATPLWYILDHCAYGTNTTAALQNLTSGTGDVTLTGDPFTSSTNFLLNGTAGAGAACKAVGFPGAALFGTGGQDIGAVQTPASTPSYPAASRVYSGVDRGDGVLGTLHASNIATAAGSGSNLSAGVLQSGVVVDDVTGTYAPAASTAVNPIGGPVL